MQMHAAAERSGVLGGRGREVRRRHGQSRQRESVKLPAELLGVDERRAEQRERVRRAAPFGEVRPLQETGAGVQQRRFIPRHRKARHDPRPSPAGEAHTGIIPFTAHNVQSAADVLLGVHHAGKLAAGHAVARRDRMAADKALHALFEHGALGGAAQRIGAVEHDEASAVFRAVEQQVFERGDECIVPAADVLYVVDERIKRRRRFPRQAPGAGAVQAFHGQAGGLIDTVGKHLARGLVAADAVLGREQKAEIADLP